MFSAVEWGIVTILFHRKHRLTSIRRKRVGCQNSDLVNASNSTGVEKLLFSQV